MYNKTKHLIGYIAAIGMLALGALLLAYEAYALIDILVAARNPLDRFAVLKAFINVLFFTRFPIRLVLGIACILVGLKNIRKPISHELMGGRIVWDYVPLKQNIAFFVVCAILLFLGFYDLNLAAANHIKLNGRYYTLDNFFIVVQWFQVVATFMLLALKVVSLCLRNSANQAPEQESLDDTFDNAEAVID
ncbi:MAG: hypothetical protein E7352_05790 [Clostridiales bacterium]|nr:hypothetical protein [Clostridiales bacterium]